MAKRSTPKRLALTVALGIAGAHCTSDETYSLDCSPARPTVGDDVILTLDYDVDGTDFSFQWSEERSRGLGVFDRELTPPPGTLGTLNNTFTATAAGVTTLQVSRDGNVVAACAVDIQAPEPDPPFQVDIRFSGDGEGAVVYDDQSCSANCQVEVPRGDQLQLIARPAANSVFARWEDDCAGTLSSTVTVTVDDNKTCGVVFNAAITPGPDQVQVPAGMFTRGCTRPTACPASELPTTVLSISPFAIDRTEVTVESYRACVAAGNCSEPAQGANCNYFLTGREQHPVNCVTWDQAREFCAAANKRLPTEAEWEFAARGPMDTRLFPWGNDDPDCTRGNYFSTIDLRQCAGPGMTTAPVGDVRFAAGASWTDAVDLAGNVSEWVQDWFAAGYYGDPNTPTVDPPGPAMGDSGQRVRRGGSYRGTSDAAFVFSRSALDPMLTNDETGFRCAR